MNQRVDDAFSGKRAALVVGITYRQLDYWARTDLVRDLLELKIIKNLLDAGIRLESVRLAFTELRQRVGLDITSAHLVISGSTVVLCRGDELIDLVQRGQGVFNILPLGGVKEQLDAAILDITGGDDGGPDQLAFSAGG